MRYSQWTNELGMNVYDSCSCTKWHIDIVGHVEPMDIYSAFFWKSIPQNDPNAAEPTWTTPYFVRHMNPDVKLLLLLRDPVER